LEIDFINDYVPQPGDTFEIMTCGSGTGEFSEIKINMEGITLVPTYTETGLTLTVAAACQIGATKYPTLDAALKAVSNGDTIKLLNNITHTSPIEVDSKTITFELGDYDLLVDTSDDFYKSTHCVLTVKNGGKVELTGTGTGKFNIKSSSHGYGIWVFGANSEVTVNNVDVTGESATGVYAKNGNVVINGDITAGHRGVSTAVVEGTSVTVNGNITVLGIAPGGNGIYADEKTTVYVTGDVTGQGTDYVGVYAGGGTIEVGGDVVSSGIGAKANSRYTEGKGEVTINGSLSAGTPFIVVGTTEKTAADITEPTTKTGFLTYSDGVCNVWIKSVGNPVAAPDAPQSLTATPGDGQMALSWATPASDGGSAITKYQVSKDNGANWTDVGLNTSHTFTGLTNGTAYTFNVRAVNGAGSGAEASTTATPTAAPVTAYTVAVNGSHAATTGAGSYAQGATVTINAGSRSSYTFAGWTSSDGITITNATNKTASFTMPAKNVTITANWSYNGSGGGGGGGGSSTPTTPAAPAAPAYKADVKAENGTETMLPVSVNKDAGTATVDAGSQGLDQGGTIITIPSVPGVGAYSVGIPVPDLSTSDVQRTLTVNTDAGSVTVPSNMLTGVSGISGSKAQITIGQGDKDALPDDAKAAIGDRPLVQLTLSIDGKQTDWSNPDAPVTVSIPYTPTGAELANPENIVVWYIDGSGNVVTIPNARYDSATGMVTFDATHFSYYAVAYNKVSFKDVANDAWYAKAISFIAAREITTGTGGGNFSPEAKLTRGQFIVMLMKAYDIAPDANPKDNFSDAGGTYYTGYLAAAKRLGISAGIGNNMFVPEKEITRQEMFTLLYNALKVIGKLPQGDSGKTLSDFTDAGQIDSWAKEAMTLLLKTGTIGGNAGILNPTSTTSRAEMAQVLYNLLSK
jgi:uncharacterized repeat protein (TIGR02543 family)